MQPRAPPIHCETTKTCRQHAPFAVASRSTLALHSFRAPRSRHTRQWDTWNAPQVHHFAWLVTHLRDEEPLPRVVFVNFYSNLAFFTNLVPPPSDPRRGPAPITAESMQVSGTSWCGLALWQAGQECRGPTRTTSYIKKNNPTALQSLALPRGVLKQ